MKTFCIDARLVRLFHQLADLNPPVGQMNAALNVVLSQTETAAIIETKQDFEDFLEQVEEHF